MDSPELAAYLRASGGLPERDAVQRGAPIGPLTPSQVWAFFLSHQHIHAPRLPQIPPMSCLSKMGHA